MLYNIANEPIASCVNSQIRMIICAPPQLAKIHPNNVNI